MNKLYNSLLVSIFLFSSIFAFSQVGISSDGSLPDPSAMLEIKSSVKGFLPPRVALTSIHVPEPVVSPVTGLHVFNTSTAGMPPDNVLPGDYYWNGTQWCPASLPQGITHGDMLYWNGLQWVGVPTGVNGQILTLVNGTPTWSQPFTQLPVIITTNPVNITENSVICGGNVSDGGSNVTMRGLCWGEDPNPTALDSSTMDGGGAGVFTSQITGLLTNKYYYIRAVASNSTGTSFGNEVGFRTSGCGDPVTVSHMISGGFAPVDKTVTYGTITEIPGEPQKCWITSNLGADRQAIAVHDSTEASAGWYWQFNTKQGYKHDGLARTPNTAWQTTNSENLDWDITNDPCQQEIGAGWRLPTNTEWANVSAAANWTNWNGPWESKLRLHAAGLLEHSSGTLSAAGHRGVFWSNTQRTATEGWYLSFIEQLSSMDYYFKGYGFPVRCLKD
jgi:hypothetical protein